MSDCPNVDTSAIITVGAGRGFVIDHKRDLLVSERLVITAAHCLPSLPPPCGASYLHERTYGALLGPLGGEGVVAAECVFVDPIADLAVLASPDAQELSDEADWREVEPLSIGEPVWQEGDVKPLLAVPELGMSEGRFVAFYKAPAWLLSLDDGWFRCTVQHCDGMLLICDAARGIIGGMSGSPIVADDGTAIGVVCLSSR